MPFRFVGISFGEDVVLHPNRSRKQAKTASPAPNSLFPNFFPINIFCRRDMRYAGAKYYLLTLDNLDRILILTNAEEGVKFTREYRVKNGINWSGVAKKYSGILIALPEREIQKLPEEDIYEWILSSANVLYLWNTKDLEISLERLKNARTACII